MQSNLLNATVTERINVTPELVILRVRPDKGVDNFSSGQYVALALPGAAPRHPEFPPEETPPDSGKLIKRAYSIGSAPETKDYLEFYIAILPTGLLTSRIAVLKEGDRIFCAPKVTGHFTLHDVPAEANLVLVSTGTGLAPFMSMLRSPGTWTPGRSISILHGVRYRRDLGYREELLEFERAKPGFRYIPFVSRDEAGEGVLKGYVQTSFQSGILEADPTRDHVFVCGNPAMIDDVETLLTGRGYIVHSKKTPGSLHLEKYW